MRLTGKDLRLKPCTYGKAAILRTSGSNEGASLAIVQWKKEYVYRDNTPRQLSPFENIRAAPECAR
jgi:hypothetical protein